MFACLDSAGRCSEAMPGLQRSTVGRDAEGTGMTIVAIVFAVLAVVMIGVLYTKFEHISQVLGTVGVALTFAILAVAFAVLAVAG